MDFYSHEFENKVMLGGFNQEPFNPSIALFMNSQNLLNLVKSNTCFKGEDCCIDLILTNRKYFFKNTCSFETGSPVKVITIITSIWLFVIIKNK